MGSVIMIAQVSWELTFPDKALPTSWFIVLKNMFQMLRALNHLKPETTRTGLK